MGGELRPTAERGSNSAPPRRLLHEMRVFSTYLPNVRLCSAGHFGLPRFAPRQRKRKAGTQDPPSCAPPSGRVSQGPSCLSTWSFRPWAPRCAARVAVRHRSVADASSAGRRRRARAAARRRRLAGAALGRQRRVRAPGVHHRCAKSGGGAALGRNVSSYAAARSRRRRRRVVLRAAARVHRDVGHSAGC